MQDLVRLQDGRIIDIAPLERGEDLLQLIDGVWDKPDKPVTIDMLHSATPITQGDAI